MVLGDGPPSFGAGGADRDILGDWQWSGQERGVFKCHMSYTSALHSKHVDPLGFIIYVSCRKSNRTGRSWLPFTNLGNQEGMLQHVSGTSHSGVIAFPDGNA
jgi:hypothetical protein